MPPRFQQTAAAFALLAALFTAPIHAQVCPFDNGGSTLENDGLVLTRYALGLRGAPTLANTSFAAADAVTIESNIACPACGLRVTDDNDALSNPIFTVADATIISRKIADFSGAALTNGIASLGSGTRNPPLRCKASCSRAAAPPAAPSPASPPAQASPAGRSAPRARLV